MLPDNFGQDVAYLMKPTPSMDDCFPATTCPECKRLVPFGITALSGDEVTILYYCLNCEYVVANLEHIVGWLSIEDLEKTNWDENL